MSEISAKVKLDYSGFVSGLKAVDSSITSAHRNVTGLKTAFLGITLAMGKLIALGAGVKNALDLGGRMSDLAASSGASAGEMLVFQQALVNAGMSADQTGMMVARLQRAIAGVNEDGQGTTDVFSKLGINIQALQGMDLTSQIQTLSSAFSGLTDQNQRTALAMQLFGRSGAEMLVLLRDATAFGVAAQQVGGLADIMDSSANKFDTLSDALGQLGIKSQQFFAGMADAIFQGADAAESLNQIDLTSWGAAVGEGMRAVGDAAKTVSGVMPYLTAAFIGLAAAKAATALQGMKFAGVLSMNIPTAITAAKVQLAGFQMQVALSGGAMQAMAITGKAAFAGLVGSARAAGTAIMAAFGPVGLVVAAASALIGVVLGRLAEAKQIEADIRRNGRSNSRDIDRNASSIKTISNEDERASVIAGINSQIEMQADLLADLEDKDGERARQIRAQIKSLEIQRGQAERVSEETMRANAAEKERARALAESAAEAAKLGENLKKALEAHDQAAEKAALDAMSPEQAERALLEKAGSSSREDFSAEVSFLRGRGESATDEEKKRLIDMLEIKKQLVEVDKKRAQEAERAAQEEAKQAQWRADFDLETRAMMAEAEGDTGQAEQLRKQMALQKMARDLVASGGMNEAEAEREAARRYGIEEAQRKQEEVAGLLSPGSLPQLKIFADSARSIGLGGSAVSNGQEIAKIQAERQREANGLLKEIRDALRRNSGLTAPQGELVFN